MTQTLAIFLDAYRSLNAKKMFWVVLLLSGLVVVSFAFLGINKQGIKLVFWQIDSELINTDTWPPQVWYKMLFVSIGIGVWLSWIATILALVSTAGIFPDLITSGSIAMVVSKPIGRLRLFVTQYVAGLLFVTLQVAIFTLVSFLVIGLRGGVWEPGLFMAVPLVVCFFSYLFSVCVLLGLLTRSTMASLLLTLLFWFMVYGLGMTENTLMMVRTMGEQGVSWEEMQAGPGAGRRPSGSRAHRASDPGGATGTKLELPSVGHADTPPNGRATQQETADEKGSSRSIETAHNITYAVKTVLPKTSETIGLLERTLMSMAELPEQPGQAYGPQARVGREMVQTIRSRSVAWVVGTSLGFELVVLSWAALIFCRRDF